jgi:hypothetical protein
MKLPRRNFLHLAVGAAALPGTFFGIAGIASLIQGGDVVLTLPNFLWSGLLLWWAAALVRQRRKLRALWPRELGPWKG